MALADATEQRVHELEVIDARFVDQGRETRRGVVEDRREVLLDQDVVEKRDQKRFSRGAEIRLGARRFFLEAAIDLRAQAS